MEPAMLAVTIAIAAALALAVAIAWIVFPFSATRRLDRIIQLMEQASRREEDSKPTKPFLSKCPCEKCGCSISFNSLELDPANQFVTCPHCHQQTRLFVPA